MNLQKIAAIQKGCNLNDAIFSEAVEKFRGNEFKTEKDVARFIDRKIKKAGAKNAFDTIVASGKNAVEWHHKPSAKRLLKGFCVIDFGSKFSGYCSDMTRTIYLGKASAHEKRIYKIVLSTQEKCIRKIKAGASGKDIYYHAKKSLGKYADYFGHGLGHGLARLIHAEPRLSKKGYKGKGRTKLLTGDVVTVEPGVYIPKKLGIRIEDDVLVKRNGYEVLSHSTRKLIEISQKRP